MPSELDGTALMVFIELNECFESKKNVSEGLLTNAMWGLQQAGYAPNHVASGFTALRHKGYIYYSDAGGQRISDFDFVAERAPVWLRYDKKFTDLFVKNETSGLVL